MKYYSWMMVALCVSTMTLCAQSKDDGVTSGQKSQCLEMDEEDTTDALAIPLDEDAFDQCMEEDRLEKGYPKK